MIWIYEIAGPLTRFDCFFLIKLTLFVVWMFLRGEDGVEIVVFQFRLTRNGAHTKNRNICMLERTLNVWYAFTNPVNHSISDILPRMNVNKQQIYKCHVVDLLHTPTIIFFRHSISNESERTKRIKYIIECEWKRDTTQKPKGFILYTFIYECHLVRFTLMSNSLVYIYVAKRQRRKSTS